jgi:hypothetical protein
MKKGQIEIATVFHLETADDNYLNVTVMVLYTYFTTYIHTTGRLTNCDFLRVEPTLQAGRSQVRDPMG